MADADEIVDPEMEVRKLQDLVRKLELQNDILRAKQSTSTNKTQSPQIQNSDSDSELLNLDLVLNKDEETWLYESPKQLTPEQKSKSPYQWVREPFDQSGSDTVRKSLLFKLDEISLNKKSSPKEEIVNNGTATWNKTTRYSSPSIHSSPIQMVHQQSRIANSPPLGYPSIKQPLTSSNFNRVNTDTFTRPKKSRSNISRYNWEGPISIDNDPTSSPLIMDQNENKSHPINNDTQEKKIDVHTLAKMQEESLRQSFSPLNTRRRFSRGGKPSGGFYLSQDENSHSSLGNHETDMSPPLRQIGHANSQNSVSSSSLNSNGSSNGASPPESEDLPNTYLTAPTNKLRSNFSDSNLQHMNTRRARNVNNGQTQNGDNNHMRHLTEPRQIVRAVSPPSKLSGIPTAGRSGIPKPGSSPRSGLPKPRRSSLPVSRMNHMNDDSWKDGCY